MKCFAQNNIIHRDLKPDNILLSIKDANAVLKITEMRLSRSVDPNLILAITPAGTSLFAAPEIQASNPHYDNKVDIRSLRLVLYEMLTGRTVFNAKSFPHL